jgi:hypothetical protein
MKKIFLIIITAFVSTTAFSQEPLDTLAQLKSLKTAHEAYAGQPFSVLLNDMAVQPVSSISSGGNNAVLYYYTSFSFTEKDNYSTIVVVVTWQTPLPQSEVKAFELVNKFHLTPAALNYFRDKIVEEFIVYRVSEVMAKKVPVNNSGGNSNYKEQLKQNLIYGSFSTVDLDYPARNELGALLYNMYSTIVYKALINKIIKIAPIANIKINPNMSVSGRYEPATNTMTFKSVADMKTAFTEEFIRAAQDRIYCYGISSKNLTQIEFEVKAIRDISDLIEQKRDSHTFCSVYGGVVSNQATYLEWLYNIIDSSSGFPNYEETNSIFRILYETYQEEYSDDGPQNYPSGSLNLMQEPELIKYLHNNIQ